MESPVLQSFTLGQILDRTIEKYPDNDAVVYDDRDFRLTYRQFGELVDQLAKGLMALGIQKARKWPSGQPTCLTG